MLTVAAALNDQAIRDAAARLKKTLLLEAGAGQTRLRYQEEVDFGRRQVALVAQGQGALDVALLKLGPLMTEIAEATQAPALAIGHGQSVQAPHRRKSMMTQECVSTFEWAADTLGWLIENVGAGPDREFSAELLASLNELASRHPSPTSTPTMEPPPPSP